MAAGGGGVGTVASLFTQSVPRATKAIMRASPGTMLARTAPLGGCVFVGVGECVEVLARPLGGGLVGGEQGFFYRGFADVEGDGSVGLRVGVALHQRLVVLRHHVDLDDRHRAVLVGDGLQEGTLSPRRAAG